MTVFGVLKTPGSHIRNEARERRARIDSTAYSSFYEGARAFVAVEFPKQQKRRRKK